MPGKLLEDGSAVGDLGVGANGTIRLEMQSADPETMPIRAFKPRQEYTMPDVITVRVETGNTDTGLGGLTQNDILINQNIQFPNKLKTNVFNHVEELLLLGVCDIDI